MPQGWFCLEVGGPASPTPHPCNCWGRLARRESHLLGMGPQALQRDLGEVGIADTDPLQGGCVTAFKNLGLKLNSICVPPLLLRSCYLASGVGQPPGGMIIVCTGPTGLQMKRVIHLQLLAHCLLSATMIWVFQHI